MDGFFSYCFRILILLLLKMVSQSVFFVLFQYGQLSAHGRKFMSASLVNVKTLTSFSELRSFFLALATQNEMRALTMQFSFDKVFP